MTEALTPVDTDGDGFADKFPFDTNQDGLVDAIVLDGDEDGHYEVVLQDVNEDGVPDGLLADADGDGTYETVVIDRDEDGVQDPTSQVTFSVEPNDPASFSGLAGSTPDQLSTLPSSDPGIFQDPAVLGQYEHVTDLEAGMTDRWAAPDDVVFGHFD